MRLKFPIFALAVAAVTGCPGSKDSEKKGAASAEPAKAAAVPASAAPAAAAKPAAKKSDDGDKGGW